jgi:hypothetical protein
MERLAADVARAASRASLELLQGKFSTTPASENGLKHQKRSTLRVFQQSQDVIC